MLYRETVCELLSPRGNRRKLFYNIVNKTAPDQLCRLIPPTIQSATVSPWRIVTTTYTMQSYLSLTTGVDVENLNHYIFECPQYLNIRTTLFIHLSWLSTDCNVDSTLGNDKLT